MCWTAAWPLSTADPLRLCRRLEGELLDRELQLSRVENLVQLSLKLDPAHLRFELRVEVELLAAEQVGAVLQPAASVLALDQGGHRCVAGTLLQLQHSDGWDAAVLLAQFLLTLGAR